MGALTSLHPNDTLSIMMRTSFNILITGNHKATMASLEAAWVRTEREWPGAKAASVFFADNGTTLAKACIAWCKKVGATPLPYRYTKLEQGVRVATSCLNRQMTSALMASCTDGATPVCFSFPYNLSAPPMECVKLLQAKSVRVITLPLQSPAVDFAACNGVALRARRAWA